MMVEFSVDVVVVCILKVYSRCNFTYWSFAWTLSFGNSFSWLYIRNISCATRWLLCWSVQVHVCVSVCHMGLQWCCSAFYQVTTSYLSCDKDGPFWLRLLLFYFILFYLHLKNTLTLHQSFCWCSVLTGPPLTEACSLNSRVWYSGGSGHRPRYGTQWISHHFILLPADSALIKRRLSLRDCGQVKLLYKHRETKRCHVWE